MHGINALAQSDSISNQFIDFHKIFHGLCIMKKELTVIIPFLNEGIEIANTLQSIRETAGQQIDVLLINDSSTDGFDYEATAKQFDAFYHKNPERIGVAASRDLGVSMINTPYFLLLDGHMRFYQNDWVEEILKAVKSDERAIYCLQCKPLLDDLSLNYNVNTMGACIHINTPKADDILEPFWKYNDMQFDCPTIEIPCVLGACYVVAKNYWNYLRGLEGLRIYGNDEPFISLKTWMEGGKCILIKEIIVGHIFRKKHPFHVEWSDRIYNKLLIAELLLPIEYKNKMFSILNNKYPIETKKAISILITNKKLIMDSKMYFEKIFTRDFDFFLALNQSQM